MFKTFSNHLMSLFSSKKSPKAIYETYDGDHVENLAVCKKISINPIDELQELEKLPVWFHEEVNTPTPKIYSEIFWEIEPMGEYLYYLAGDFSKNNKGLLIFSTPKTAVFVEVNFEDDVIDVAKHDGAIEQKISEEQADISSEILNLTVEQLINKFPSSNHQFDDRVSFFSLQALLSADVSGSSRLIVHKPHDDKEAYVSLIYEEFREPNTPREFLRYTKVKVRSSLQNITVLTLVEQLLKLTNKYSDMPYVSLSGTTRA